ncbi:phage holin family protein [Halomonas sp. GXIMD04776]|uniref:phage holin family protein n=1 Tax=Halomonas sp. GXIMD04776 TaxID=3415605 RepID=UPI003CC323EB
MSSGQGPAERVIQAGRRMLNSLIATGETRLRLAVLELELERDRLLTIMMLAGASLILFAFGIGMLLLMLIVAYWEEHRVLAIGLSGGVLLLISALLALGAKRIAKQRKLMESTLSNLSQDRHYLESSRESS